MIYPKIPLAQSIIELCLAKGVTQIIISPGSRNAPLTQSLFVIVLLMKDVPDFLPWALRNKPKNQRL